MRYGLQLLPAAAVFIALGCYLTAKVLSPKVVTGIAAGLIVISYVTVWYVVPICLREARANGQARMEFDKRLAIELRKLPSSASLMMDCGAHSGAVQLAGIPFRRVLRESNPPLWETALSEPGKSADYVITLEGDNVWRAVRLFPQGLVLVTTVSTPGGPKAFIYHSTR